MFGTILKLRVFQSFNRQGKHVIRSYDKYLTRQPSKKVLLSYISQPFLMEREGEKTRRFSNSGLALSWAQALNEIGYSVDIIDWDNTKFIPRETYDLVILHGGKNFKNIYQQLNGRPVIILYLTGSYWKFNNAAEDQRRQDFQNRHNVYIGRDRYIYDSEDPVGEVADGIIVLGDPSMADTFPNGWKILTINNASYPDDHFNKTTKDYTAARQNFLFFAGSGNIHKGLDLLIDAFKNLTDQHLYIVTVPDRVFLDAFKQELKRPNIHLIGEVGMRDEKFYEVMNRCAFVILPSCSEGQAGSVVEAMNQGLIPIVSKETRLDARNYGEILKENSIRCIQRTVIRFSAIDSKEVEKMAKRVREVAVKVHNPEKFRKDLKAAVKEILASKKHNHR